MEACFKTSDLIYAKNPIELNKAGNLEIKLGNNQIPNQSQVEISLKIIIKNEELVVDLKATFEITAICGRCLEEKSINESNSRVFRINLNSENDYELSLNQEKIDVLPFITEIILDKMNENYICHENCKGLCTTCGINLNNYKCSHLEKNLKESPFSSLSQLDL